VTGRLEIRIRRKARLKPVRLLLIPRILDASTHEVAPPRRHLRHSRQNPSGTWRRTGRSNKAIYFTEIALWACPLSLSRHATHDITDSTVTGLTGAIQWVDVEVFIVGGADRNCPLGRGKCDRLEKPDGGGAFSPSPQALFLLGFKAVLVDGEVNNACWTATGTRFDRSAG
jgi:hypothetical protein